MSRKSEGQSVFVHDRNEFLSIWAIAHEWEALNPQQTNLDSIPAELKRRIDKVVRQIKKRVPQGTKRSVRSSLVETESA